MPTIDVENQKFSFPHGWDVVKYDDSQHHQARHEWKFKVLVTKDPKVWSRSMGQAAVDVLAWDPTKSRYLLIEVKDYRWGAPPPMAELPDVVARKVRDSLAGLAVALFQPASDVHPWAQRLSHAENTEVWLDIQWPTLKEAKLVTRPSPDLVRRSLHLDLQTKFHRSGLPVSIVDPATRQDWSATDIRSPIRRRKANPGIP